MERILIVVSSLAISSLLGEWWNLEKGAERLSEYLKKKFRIGNEKFSEGLITAFLLYCIGSMTILGAIQEGTGGSSDLLLTKSLMDGFSSVLLASAFGIGVLFSAIPLVIFQGAINLFAMGASSFFTLIFCGINMCRWDFTNWFGNQYFVFKKLRILICFRHCYVVILIWGFINTINA